MTEFVKESVKSGIDVNTIKKLPQDLPLSAREMQELEERHLLNGESFAILKPIKGLDSIAERKYGYFGARMDLMFTCMVKNCKPQLIMRDTRIYARIRSCLRTIGVHAVALRPYVYACTHIHTRTYTRT